MAADKEALAAINKGASKVGDVAEKYGKRKVTIMWWVLVASCILSWILGRAEIPW